MNSMDVIQDWLEQDVGKTLSVGHVDLDVTYSKHTKQWTLVSSKDTCLINKDNYHLSEDHCALYMGNDVKTPYVGARCEVTNKDVACKDITSTRHGKQMKKNFDNYLVGRINLEQNIETLPRYVPPLMQICTQSASEAFQIGLLVKLWALLSSGNWIRRDCSKTLLDAPKSDLMLYSIETPGFRIRQKINMNRWIDENFHSDERLSLFPSLKKEMLEAMRKIYNDFSPFLRDDACMIGFTNGVYDTKNSAFSVNEEIPSAFPHKIYEHDFDEDLKTPAIDTIMMQKNEECYSCLIKLIGSMLLEKKNSCEPFIIGSGEDINNVLMQVGVKQELRVAENERKVMQPKKLRRHIPFRIEKVNLNDADLMNVQKELGTFYIKCITQAEAEPQLPVVIRDMKIKYFGSRSGDSLVAFMNQEYNEAKYFTYEEDSWTKWDTFKSLVMKQTGLNARQVKVDMDIWKKFGVKVIKKKISITEKAGVHMMYLCVKGIKML